MADYFDSANNNGNENANSAAPAATNGDAPMDDEILVSR
jgi:THO complex subunit 4